MMSSNEKCLKIVELLKIYMFDINHALSTKNILSIFNENIPRLKCDECFQLYLNQIFYSYYLLLLSKSNPENSSHKKKDYDFFKTFGRVLNISMYWSTAFSISVIRSHKSRIFCFIYFFHRYLKFSQNTHLTLFVCEWKT